MKKYEYKFVGVPVAAEKKGIVETVRKGATFETCRQAILEQALEGWRLVQVVVPFNEKTGVYGAYEYQIIFEKEIN